MCDAVYVIEVFYDWLTLTVYGVLGTRRRLGHDATNTKQQGR